MIDEPNGPPSDDDPDAIKIEVDDDEPVSLTQDDEPISLVDDDAPAATGSKIHAFGAGAVSSRAQTEAFQRTPNVTGQGAVRCRVFHSKINDQSLEHMQKMINDWLDANPEIEVKHVGHMVGDLTGKKVEPNVIVVVWY
jgi:hypothetical protein